MRLHRVGQRFTLGNRQEVLGDPMEIGVGVAARSGHLVSKAFLTLTQARRPMRFKGYGKSFQALEYMEPFPTSG
jgi:hypothetical protein